MKLEDLCVGNYVKFYDCKDDCGGHRVDYLNEIDEEIGIDGEIEPTSVLMDSIVPLPIAPHFLSKNGFKSIYSKEDTVWEIKKYDEHKEIEYWIVIDLVVKGTCRIHNYIENREYRGPIEYVHELQQLVKLCKIDKKFIVHL